MTTPSASGTYRSRLRLRTLLAGIAVVAVVVGAWALIRTWCAWNYSHLVIFETLHERIENGDSVDDVQRLLGPGEPVSDPSLPARIAEAYPDRYPQGVEQGDRFLLYKLRTGLLVYLQFRDRRLVNHVAEDYAQYPSSPTLIRSVK